MANELDEMTGPTSKEGRDIHVITKQIPVTVGIGSLIFEGALWVLGTIPGLVLLATGEMPRLQAFGIAAAGTLPGLIFVFMKVSALNHLQQLQQKIQADASQIDNYLEQRVVILQNVARLVAKSIDLDKDVMKSVAAYRSGTAVDMNRNQTAAQVDGLFSRLNVSFEDYPSLKAHATIADAMQQNSYLQKEITAARTLYNDTVAMWNIDIFSWPAKQIVAARAGYTTRLPFVASAEIKDAARGTFL